MLRIHIKRVRVLGKTGEKLELENESWRLREGETQSERSTPGRGS